jgi:hypothetical protein
MCLFGSSSPKLPPAPPPAPPAPAPVARAPVSGTTARKRRRSGTGAQNTTLTIPSSLSLPVGSGGDGLSIPI